jgi:hypothetical protein
VFLYLIWFYVMKTVLDYFRIINAHIDNEETAASIVAELFDLSKSEVWDYLSEADKDKDDY